MSSLAQTSKILESSHKKLLGYEAHSNTTKPVILKCYMTCLPNPTVFKQIQHNINLFDYKIRRHFNVSSIPQYNNGYKKALELRQQYQQRQNYYIEDVTTKSNTNAHYVISEQDQVLINASDLFLRRTPSLDVDSHTTMSDNSYISAAESVVTVIYRRMNNSTL
uniref:Uncharacterized protein n=1 Tax=Rhizophagus irregularis (strain DAOM 181602 / DAOM 197198 / MUCL 43194) TaxID=747089 RepID=U9V8H7_RHIID